MFLLKREQKVCHIGGISIGGQPGEHPPVLIGSIFHKGDRLIKSRHERVFDRDRARELLKRQEELSQQTGIPAMIDLVGNSGQELKAYLEFVAATTPIPLGIDAWRLQPKLEAAQYAKELGLLDRLFYNSLNPWSEDLEREVASIGEIGIKHLIVVAFDPTNPEPVGRLKSLEKLLRAVEGLQLESILVDTTAMNLPATAFCSQANYWIKQNYGLPVGSAPANGTYMWKFAQQAWGGSGLAATDAAIHAIATVLWHDFLFYGPLTAAGRIFPAVATASAFLATLRWAEDHHLPQSQDHPLNRLFIDFAQELGAKGQGGSIGG